MKYIVYIVYIVYTIAAIISLASCKRGPPLHKTLKDEEYVLLDILFEELQYINIIQLKIQSSFLPEKEAPLTVESPSLEDLTGDKLTAFAPNTTGIPYFKNTDSMSMEIIKQLYDIGNLVDNITDLETIT